MRGLALHDNLKGAVFLGGATTEPVYRMYSIGDVHPGMLEVGEGGVAVKGELYLVSDDVLARIEAGEPPSLYRGVVKLAGGCRPFGILYPQEMAEGQHRDISQFGDWRLYMRALSVVSAYGTKLGKWLIPWLN